MEERMTGISPFNWGIRNKGFMRYALQGMDLQRAYDLAMCIMYRAEGKDLPWGKPSPSLLGTLKNYEPKEEE